MGRGLHVFQCFLITALSLILPAQTNTAPAETVSGAGCVAAGVEGGCLILKDAESGTIYDLFFTGDKPAPGKAIQFTGAFRRNTVTYCMQGKHVQVKEWHRIRMRCPPPSADKK